MTKSLFTSLNLISTIALCAAGYLFTSDATFKHTHHLENVHKASDEEISSRLFNPFYEVNDSKIPIFITKVEGNKIFNETNKYIGDTNVSDIFNISNNEKLVAKVLKDKRLAYAKLIVDENNQFILKITDDSQIERIQNESQKILNSIQSEFKEAIFDLKIVYSDVNGIIVDIDNSKSFEKAFIKFIKTNSHLNAYLQLELFGKLIKTKSVTKTQTVRVKEVAMYSSVLAKKEGKYWSDATILPMQYRYLVITENENGHVKTYDLSMK